MNKELQIGFLIYPGVTQLDATGPAQVLSQLPGAQVQMIWKDLQPVSTDAGFALMPTTTIKDCPPLDVICVPGGAGQFELMDDQPVLDFLAAQGAQAQFVTSVCTGSLLLGAAGLLDGYQSACHWAFRDLLPQFGATPVPERIVQDRNRISGGGVTAGIDFGLMLASRLMDEQTAKSIQLALEYDPQPPFDAGSPEKAGPVLESKLRQFIAKGFRGRGD